ncbi:heat-shock protein, partial [Trifolium medium]|nr:heat-shock protein [Trifolium medium]
MHLSLTCFPVAIQLGRTEEQILVLANASIIHIFHTIWMHSCEAAPLTRITACGELMAMILAFELARQHSWYNIWLESDSKVALGAFKNHDIVPWILRN